MQTLEHFKGADGTILKVSIKETNSFRGIPYADYFNVNTEWIVVAVPPSESACNTINNTLTGASSDHSNHSINHNKRGTVKVIIYLDFLFHKSTWLQGTIESNTKAELIGVYELWLESAHETLRRSMDRRPTATTATRSLHITADKVGEGDNLADIELGGVAAGQAGERGGGGGGVTSKAASEAGPDDMDNNNNNININIDDPDNDLGEIGVVRMESGEITPSGE